MPLEAYVVILVLLVVVLGLATFWCGAEGHRGGALLLGLAMVGVLWGGVSTLTGMDEEMAKKREATLRRELPGMTQQAKVWCEEHRIYPITLERARPSLPEAPWDFQVTYTDLEGVVRGVRVTCPPGDRCYLAPGEGK